MRPADRLVLVVELVCGLAITIYALVLGFSTGLPVLFVLAALAAAVTIWRAARTPRTAGPRRPAPGATTAAATPVRAAGPPSPPGTLSPSGRRELDRIVAVLGRAGIFRPHVPDPELLVAGAAEHGEPVTLDAVFAALGEADHWHPGFDVDDYTAGLAHHGSHTEQDPEHLRRQVADLAHLVGPEPAVTVHEVELADTGGAQPIRTRVLLTVGGRRLDLDYPGAGKYLSTMLHVGIARAVREAGAPVRLAWFWSDQGVWLTALPAADPDRVRELNDRLGTAALPDPWEWVDEAPPHAAGEIYRAEGP